MKNLYLYAKAGQLLKSLPLHWVISLRFNYDSKFDLKLKWFCLAQYVHMNDDF